MSPLSTDRLRSTSPGLPTETAWPAPEAREQPGHSRTCSAGARSMAPAADAGSSRCARSRGPLSPWPPARSCRVPSSPHRRPDADSATPLAREAAPARGGGGGGRPGEGSSGTEAERGRKGGGAVGNGGAQGRGRPGSNPTGDGWMTTKAGGTAGLGASSCSPARIVQLGELGLLEPRTPLFSLLGPRSLFRSQN